jgi:hypothetical protein
MPSHEQFYRDRAAEAREAADAADLANVRERHLRAASAWQAMAERAGRVLSRADRA